MEDEKMNERQAERLVVAKFLVKWLFETVFQSISIRPPERGKKEKRNDRLKKKRYANNSDPHLLQA